MLELICDERFPVDGIPVDHGSYHNHGRRQGTTAVSGATLGKTAIGFPTATSHVAIARDPFPPARDHQWAPLVALRIEVVARIDPAAALTLTILEGDGSFRFGINQRALDGQFSGPPGADTHVRSDEAHAPDGLFHQVPANQWVTLGFDHNGYSEMQLSIEGVVVGRTMVAAGVPPVQAGGVTVGNRRGGGQPFLGAIDQLRVWRDYPDAIRQEFWCRPFTKKAADCWEQIFRAVADWATTHPAELATLRSLIDARMRAALHALYTLPPAQQADVRAAIDHFMKLWCAGHLHSHEMREALQRLVAAVTRAGLGPLLHAGAEIDAVTRRARLKLSVDCDPAIAAFLQLLEAASGGHATA
jgi:hypothetical protein